MQTQPTGSTSGLHASREDAAQAAAQASERGRRFTHDALEQAEEKLRDIRHSVDPLVDKVSQNAKKLARQGMDMASDARHKAQDSLSHYAKASTRYVSEQPLRSVLIAAAVGAAVALLVSAGRKRRD